MTARDPDGTRRRIVAATIEALVEVGHAGTTTVEVQRRAGVSRGALLHHFGDRASLLAAAVEEIGARRYEEMLASLAHHGADTAPVSFAASLRAMRRRLSSPAYLAEAELWAAARTDPALADALAPVERKLGEQLRQGLDRALATVDERWRADVAVVALHYVRGLAALDALRRPSGGPASSPPAARLDAELAPLVRVVEALGRAAGDPA